jgi:hypothetical protein
MIKRKIEKRWVIHSIFTSESNSNAEQQQYPILLKNSSSDFEAEELNHHEK